MALHCAGSDTIELAASGGLLGGGGDAGATASHSASSGSRCGHRAVAVTAHSDSGDRELWDT